MSKDAHRTISELLEDIVLWGDRIPALIGNCGFDEFSRHHQIHLSVWKCVEVIGEASSRLLKAGYATGDVGLRDELRRATDMRNRLTHGYAGVDLMVLWTTSRQFVPALVARIRVLIGPDGDR